MPGVVLFNPHSGPEETSSSDLAGEFPDARITEIEGKAIKRQVEEAIADGEPTFLAVAGGDGTIRCAAGVLADTDLPLLPVPAGTRNHFAREVGIATLDDAGRAATGEVIQVDVGDVNGEVFVNNAGIGVYPRIVKERTTHQKRFSKQTATVLATWGQMRSLHRFDVTVHGETIRAWMIFVGNGRYGTSVFDVATRESLDDGVLDVRILRADGRLARTRVVVALLAGRLDRSEMSEFKEVTAIDLAFDRPRIDVALDGEIFPMETPLRFRCRPKALRVLVPPSSGSSDGE